MSAALTEGRITAEALVHETFGRIAYLDPKLMAFIRLTEQRALSEARASDVRRAKGQIRGPLDGIPYTVKDIFDVAGEPTLAGSKLLSGQIADQDCFAVRRLSEAGMVLVGKTHTVQFAFHINGTNRDFGTPRNPWAEEHHLPGGSSSGSAVAVAAGMVPMALGSDTAGSIRVPSALCGVVGFKPSWGRLGRGGVCPLAWSLDTIGPITRSVEDAISVFKAFGGPDPEDETTIARAPVEVVEDPDSRLDSIEVLICETVFLDDCDPEILAATEEMARSLAVLGAMIRRGELTEIAEAHERNREGVVIATEAWAVNGELFEACPDAIDPIGSWVKAGRGVSAKDYYHAMRQRADLQRRISGRLGDRTVILSPTTTKPALPLSAIAQGTGTRGGYSRNTGIGSYLNLPAFSIPAGTHSSGLPLGAMIAARPFEDALAIRVARALEANGRNAPHPDLRWIERPDKV